jgi:AraC-like DNA-binding protein
MVLSRNAAFLSPLYRNCLFRSDARVDAHSLVAQELIDHVLRWKRGAVDATMFKGELNRLKMYILRYGAEVEVTPRPFEDFVLVHTSLRGAAEIESDGHRLGVAEGRTAVIAPQRRIRLRWYEGTEQLILKVPRPLICDICARDEDREVPLGPGFIVPRGLGSQWNLIMESLLNLLSMPQDSGVRAAWLDHFERNVAMFLLLHQPAGPSSPVLVAATPSFEPADAALRGGDAKRMDAVLEYMHGRLSAPVSLEDLARAARVSVRTLNALCHRHHGVTPMELLRNLRLDAVRTRLLLQPDASITETALEFGFGHLGRFSAYYHARFNELPRDTQTKRKD